MPRVSSKVASFTESVIREMTRLALDQYAITWGAKCFRDAIAAKVARTYAGWAVDPETELTVTCGATEGVVASCLALLDPGDEVVVFEPWYENYWPDTVISGAVPRFVTLHEPDWSIDEAELRAAFGPRTRAIIVNTPNNPTGKVFRLQELSLIAELCQRWDAYIITDEIYEHLQFVGSGGHIPPATVAGLEDRTIAVNALSKTYAVTGWRVGWVIAPPAATNAIRKVHDFLTVGAAAPLQEGGVAAMNLPASYYTQLTEGYRQ